MGQDRGDIGDDVVADLDAEPAELGDAPVDEAEEVLATRVPGGQSYLPTGPRQRLEDDDLVAPFAGDAGGLQPPGPAPTTTIRRRVAAGAIVCGIEPSRPVAALWMHTAASPS